MSSTETKIHKSKIDDVHVVDSKLFLTGSSYFEGFPVTNYGQIRTSIVLESPESRIVVPLGGDVNNNLRTSERDYSYAQFSTVSHAGVDLTDLLPGRYRLRIKSDQEELTNISSPNLSRAIEDISFQDDYYIRVSSLNGEVVVLKQKLLTRAENETFFSIQYFDIKDNKLSVLGYFGPKGYELAEWSDIDYYMHLVNSNGVSRTIKLANGNRPDVWELTAEPQLDQSKAVFTTKNYDPIDLKQLQLPFGTYRVSILAKHYSKILRQDLTKELKVAPLVGYPKKSVAIIGSCVSRDLFNSRLNASWKDGYQLTGTHYQMSFVSLMANTLEIPDVLREELNDHDYRCTAADYAKKFSEVLLETPPEFLLIDLRIDARFGVIKIHDSYITDNLWKIGQTSYYDTLRPNLRYSMRDNREQYISLFTEAVARFRDFHVAYLPQTKIILNSARGVGFYRDGLKSTQFKDKAINLHNQYWSELDSLFSGMIDCDVITPSKRNIGSNVNHPWGKGPIHFEKDYYNYTATQLMSRTHNNEVHYSLLAKA